MSEVGALVCGVVEQQVKGFLLKDIDAINAQSAKPYSAEDIAGPLGKQMALFGDGTVTYTFVEGSLVANMCLVHVLQEGGLGMEDWVKCLKKDGTWRVDDWGQDEPSY